MTKARQLVERIYTDEVFSHGIAPDIFSDSISHAQGIFLSQCVDAYRPAHVVELGFRFGISSLWIQSARHAPASHVIVDPYHHIPAPPVSTVIDDFVKKQKGVVLEDTLTSQEYLARALSKQRHVDMVFIDASQWFDSVMTDMYFVSKVLKIGGIVIIRNLYNKPVRKALMFYLRNLSFVVEGVPLWVQWVIRHVPVVGELLLRYVQRPLGLCVIRLTGPDERVTKNLWRHFVSF